jgi:hypothetical protein
MYQGVEYLSIQGAAAALGRSVRTLRRLEKAQILPRPKALPVGPEKQRWYAERVIDALSRAAESSGYRDGKGNMADLKQAVQAEFARSQPQPWQAMQEDGEPPRGRPENLLQNQPDDEEDESRWDPGRRVETMLVCPLCGSSALNCVQDAYQRAVWNCERHGRIVPILVRAPDRSSGRNWGDNYGLGEASMSTPRQRARGLRAGDVAGATRARRAPAQPKFTFLDPYESPQRFS